MRWLIPFLAYPCLASASSNADRVPLISNFPSSGLIIRANKRAIFRCPKPSCSATKRAAGKHLRMRAKVEPQAAANQYMVKGWVEEIDANGTIGIVSSPHIMALAGEESEISTGTSNGVEIDFKVTVTPAK